MNPNGIFDISGKVAVVTGAARGLGQALALGLSAAGAKVALADVLDMSDTLLGIEGAGGEAIAVPTDVRHRDQVEHLVAETVKRFGAVDILVNNAGINLIAPSLEFTEEEWDLVLDVNLKGMFLCCQAVGRVMRGGGGGAIVNIGSINSEYVFPNCAAYNASKAGVLLLTKTLAYEWGPWGVRVNAVCPGFMETPMLEGIQRGREGLAAERKKLIPLRRFAAPEDLVGAVIFLVSPAARYITGHALYVDGGWTLGWPGVERVGLDAELDRALRGFLGEGG
ncbi:MAG: Dehydrogenase [Acetothermia bacterium 64_32]|nr:MAG: Dehydrogenase [Acetothermia bacterium 64_32]